MLNKAIISAFCGVGIMLSSVSAHAQDVYIDDDDDVVVRERVIDADDDFDEDDDPGPRVYGWEDERPIDCGAYHYWDGEECLDARRVPPDIGYKD